MIIFNRFNKTLLFSFIVASSSAISDTWHTEDFESTGSEATLDGKTITTISNNIWTDGGSDSYLSSSEYNSGSSSYVIVGSGDHTATATDGSIEEKPLYGSVYTETLDFSNQSTLEMSINYLFTNAEDSNPGGYFSVEGSSDGGETFTTIKSYTLNGHDVLVSSKKEISAEKLVCKASCDAPTVLYILGVITGSLDGIVSACKTVCTETFDSYSIGGRYWYSDTINVSNYISDMSIFRIKSYLTEGDDVSKIFIDDVSFECDNCRSFSNELSPVFSKTTIIPTSDPVTSDRTLYNTETFDSKDDDWGIWLDGGRSVYSTEFLAASGRNIALKDFYSGMHNGYDAETGEDLGYQKDSYSSIVTENLNFTEVADLEMSFSFVSYNMQLAEPSNAELIASERTGLTNEDEEEILGYVVGSDYVVISLSTDSGITYQPVKTLTYGKDFLNLIRYDMNINIPGDITSAGRLTTTTKIKIQSFNDTEERQFYVDDINIYTIGSNTSPAGNAKSLDWSSYEYSLLSATDGSTSTYDLINKTHIIPEFYNDASFLGNNDEMDTDDVKEKPGLYGAVEHTDCDHPEFGEHITQTYDNDLAKYIFSFFIHEEHDTDRCRTDGLYDDRQRVEIKTYNESYDFQQGVVGETHFYAWKMKLPTGFDASDKFTHLHQVKPVGGENAGMPTITLTANGAHEDEDTGLETSPAELRLRYSPSTASQVTVKTVPLSRLEGKWVQLIEKVTYGIENQGRYELMILDAANLNAEPLLEFESYSFNTSKGGDFSRPKWGIYRSILQPDMIKDEEVKFADFVVLEVPTYSDGYYGDLGGFGQFVAGLSDDGSSSETANTTCIATTPTNLSAANTTTSSSKVAWINADSNLSHFNVRYRIFNTETWTKVKVEATEKELTLSELTANTNYEWQVRSVCPDDSGSNYLHTEGSFTTAF